MLPLLYSPVFICLMSLPLGAIGWSVIVIFPAHIHSFLRF